MSKTRIAAWVMFATALALTILAMFMGVDMISALSAILTGIWTAALGLLAFAYKDFMKSKSGGE